MDRRGTRKFFRGPARWDAVNIGLFQVGLPAKHGRVAEKIVRTLRGSMNDSQGFYQVRIRMGAGLP